MKNDSLLLLNGFVEQLESANGWTKAIGAAETALSGASPREKRHLAAAKAWAAGQIIAATDVWEDILVDHPTDALALRFAHDSYFYLGHSLSIRNSVARVLPFWDPTSPNYGYVLGQYAFGLEEAGELRRAEEFGRQAIARNAEDGCGGACRRPCSGDGKPAVRRDRVSRFHARPGARRMLCPSITVGIWRFI